MMKLIVRALTSSWNLIFAYSDIGEFRNRNDFLLAECTHLICWLWHSNAWCLTTSIIIVELKVLLKDTAIFAWGLNMNLRVLVSRSSSAWRVQAIQTLRPCLIKVYNHIWSSRWQYHVLLIVDLLWSRGRALDFLHDLDQVLLWEMIWSARSWAGIPASIAVFLLAISSTIWRDIKAIIAFLHLSQLWRWNRWRDTGL